MTKPVNGGLPTIPGTLCQITKGGGTAWLLSHDINEELRGGTVAMYLGQCDRNQEYSKILCGEKIYHIWYGRLRELTETAVPPDDY